MDSGWILGGFWVDSGWILDGFWVDSGWILGGFWVDSGWILVGFWSDSGGFWSDSGRILVGFWSDSGRILGRILVNFLKFLVGSERLQKHFRCRLVQKERPFPVAGGNTPSSCRQRAGPHCVSILPFFTTIRTLQRTAVRES